MPRIARGLVEGYAYHVINRGNGKQKVFHKAHDYDVFIELMKEAKKHFPVKVFAYCLMPNHFHMILMPLQSGENLSCWMQWLMTSHVRRYHKHYESDGHVWQGRFKSFIIQNDGHLFTVARYIEGNPVRAMLVNSAKDWKWSSHLESCGIKSPQLADKMPLPLPENWTSFADRPLTSTELEKIRQSVKRQSPFGSFNWQEKISSELGLESTLRPRGRPRKMV